MRYLRIVAFTLLPVVLMALAGCGGSSGGTTTDPLSNAANQQTPTIFGNVSTVTGRTGITLGTDRSAVDVNNGQVLAIARVVSDSAPVAGVPVTFSIVAPANGPATIEAGMTTVRTDSYGVAVTRITAGNTLSTTNVIIAATVRIEDEIAMAQASFQIIRGIGVISFMNTSVEGTVLSNTEKYNSPATEVTFNQLVPFMVTDSNGNPRVGVPVKLGVYSQSGSSAITIDFLKDGTVEPTANTVTTDSSGKGIFNVAVTIPVPSNPGGHIADSIVYKAATNDPDSYPIPLTAYGGCVVNSAREAAPVTPPVVIPAILISPTTAYFGNEQTVHFTITGGTPPYTVTATNPQTVSVALQPDGHTVLATLLDNSAWVGWKSFSVIDKNGEGAAVTPQIWRDYVAATK